MTQASLPERPLVTFALFAYNQERYIRDAVEGAFSQTYQPLEIILSDDCSTDRTFEIMQEMAAGYKGPHAVRVRRSARNLGISPHFSEVVGEASSQIIVLAAGDDISLPHRTSVCAEALIQDSSLSFVEVSYKEFGGDEVEPPCGSPSFPRSHGRISIRSRLNGKAPATKGACRAIRKSGLEIFPPLDERCPTEDTPTVIRLLYSGDGFVLPDVAAHLRRHERNLSAILPEKSDHIDRLLGQYARDSQLAAAKGLIGPKEQSLLLRRMGGRLEYDKFILSSPAKWSSGIRSLVDILLHSKHTTILQRFKLLAVHIKKMGVLAFRGAGEA